MKRYYLPRVDKELVIWLLNFAAKLNGFASKYGVTASEVSDVQAAAISFQYWMNYHNQYTEYVLKLTAYRNELRDGLRAGGSPSIVPVAPVVGAIPPPIAAGFLQRVRALVIRIKGHLSYTEADGRDLGIIGEERTTDFVNLKPSLFVRLVAGGQPELNWKRQGTQAIAIYVSRNGGDFSLLTISTQSLCIDRTPLPSLGLAEVWEYKAIYRDNDAPIGQWSDTISITVKGAI